MPETAAKYRVEWSPAEGSVIVTRYAHVAWQTLQITASVIAESSGGDSGGGSSSQPQEPPPSVTGYAVEIDPEKPAGLILEADGSGVRVAAPDALPTAFPVVDLEYQINRQEFHCRSFADLPPEADEVIAFIPDPSGQRDWTITATATLSDGTRHSAAFVMRLLQNFDTGRDQLMEAVNARRSSNW